MDWLKGKCIKATKTFQLANKIVDGSFRSSSDFYIPRIQKDHIYMIESASETSVFLRSITSGEWDTCELTIDEIEDFKIVNRDMI